MKKLIITALILTISSSSLAYAKATKMIFWYPGEAGSTKEAQPILDLFFAYLNKQPNTSRNQQAASAQNIIKTALVPKQNGNQSSY